MRHLLTVLLICCLATCLALAAEPNPASNPGFEQAGAGGAPVGWRANSQYPFERVEIVRGDPALIRSGLQALRLVQTGKRPDGSPTTGSLHTDDGIAIQPRTAYELRFWAKGAGTVQASLYCYQGKGDTASFTSMPAGAVFARVGGDGVYALKDGEPWQECRYTFTLPADTGVGEVRLVLIAHGTVLVDDVFFGPQGAAPAAPAAAEQKRVRPNLLAVGRARTAPRLDGVLDNDEYATRSTGLLDADAQTVYAPGGDFGLSWDGERLYLGVRLRLPVGYKLQTLANRRDDPALIATRDVFYLMVRTDTQAGAQTYQGAYLAVASDGTLYDAWEQISWAEGYCRRDAAWNADWQVRSVVKKEAWTLELSVPLTALRLSMADGGARCLASFGFHLPPQRITWQAHPNWFDHFAAFGEVALRPSETSLNAWGLQGLQQGHLDLRVWLRNPGATAAPYDLTFLVSTPTMVGGQVAGWAFETALGVQPREVVGDQEVYRSHQPVVLQPGAQEIAGVAASMPKLGHYVLEVLGRLGDEPVLYQKLPFHYLPPITGTLTPVPSQELIRADLSFTGARPDQQGQFEIRFRDQAGKVALRQGGAVRATTMAVPVSMASLPPGDYQVALILHDRQGRAVHTHETTFRKWATPVWQKQPVGLEALGPDWVPAPWTPLQRRGATVSLWGRDFTFGRQGLLIALTSQGQPLLAAPVVIKYRVAGKQYTFALSEPQFPAPGKGRAEVVIAGTSPHFRLSARQRLEFDGMDLLRLVLTPLRPVQIEGLWVEVPLRDVDYGYLGWAESLHQSAWQAGLVADEDFAAPRRYTSLWLGNDHRGVGFFAENYKGWLINASKPRITMTSQGHARTLQLRLVNEPSTVTAPVQATFGLQPTPVKPLFDGWRNLRPQGLAIVPPPANLVMPSPDYWNSGYSKPSPRNWQVLTDLIAHVRAQGQKAYPYIGLFYVSPYDYIKRDYPFDTFDHGRGVPRESIYRTAQDATRLEEWFYFKEDWDLVPSYVSHPDPETRSEALVSAGSRSYQDFFVHGVAEMLKRSDLDGLYLDIDNPVMNMDERRGLVYRTKDGATEGTVEQLATRDLYKRLVYVFDKLRGPARKPYLLGHGAPHAFPYMSFWDVCFHGEEIKPAKPFEATRMFLQQRLLGNPCGLVNEDPTSRNWEAYYYRAASNGIPYGLPMMYLPQYGYFPELNVAAHAREHVAWTFLHNSLLWPAYIPAGPVYDFWSKVEVPFGMGDAVFHPYWDNGVTAEPGCVKVSYWTKPGGETLVAAGNWSDEPVTARVTLPPALAQFTTATDMEQGGVLKVAPGFQVTVPPHDLRVFRLGR